MIAVDDPLSASLLWLAKQQGITLTRDALIAGLPLQNNKLMPANLARAASRVGITTQAVQQSLLRINNQLLPCILVLTEQRAGILLSIDKTAKTAEFLFMPEGSKRTIELKELAGLYSGTAIYCYPEYPLDQRAYDLKQRKVAEGHWFWSVIKENRRLYGDVLVAALFINIFALTMPLFVMNVYDRVVPNLATDTLWMLAAGVFIIFCADLCLRLLRSWFIDLAANRADIRLSARIMEQVLGQRLEARPASVGSFASNVQAFESIRSFIGSMTVTVLIDLPFFLLFVLIIMLIGWPMAIPVMVGVVLLIFYALAVQGKMRTLSDAISEASAQRNSGLIENLVGAESVRAFNATGRAQTLWEKATLFVSVLAIKMRMLGASVGITGAWVQQSTSVAVMIVGVYLVFAGELSQGGLIAAYMLSSRAMAPVTQLAGLLSQYHQAATAMESLENLMTSPQEREQGKTLISRPTLQGNIRLKDVSFSYPNAQKPALDGINLDIKAGEKIAILGRAGSGKSSLEKLLMGLYRPTAGSIYFDEVHQEQIDISELRRNIAYIPQDIHLVFGSVYDNITLAAPNASREEILAAVNDAGLQTVIGQSADGLAMPVGENGNLLSGGQKQSVAVARAFIEERNILLFDEPSSAMDSSLENHLIRSIKRRSQGKTLIVITHRNSLLALVDRLIVMDGGKIIADGPKQQVLEALAAGTLKKVAP